MWNHATWGPMYGWWMMPIFGLICMAIFVFVISRIFNRDGCRGPFNLGAPGYKQKENELVDEIKALRREVDELRKAKK